MFQSAPTFDDERRNHCFFEGQGYVCSGLLLQGSIFIAMFCNGVAHESLQSTETEIQPRSVGHWPRKLKVTGLGDMLHNLATAARVGAAEHLGAAWYGPAFVVPLMLVVHILIFAILLRGRR